MRFLIYVMNLKLYLVIMDRDLFIINANLSTYLIVCIMVNLQKVCVAWFCVLWLYIVVLVCNI